MKCNTSHFYSIHCSSTNVCGIASQQAHSIAVAIIMQWPHEHLWEKLTYLISWQLLHTPTNSGLKALVKNPHHFPHFIIGAAATVNRFIGKRMNPFRWWVEHGRALCWTIRWYSICTTTMSLSRSTDNKKCLYRYIHIFYPDLIVLVHYFERITLSWKEIFRTWRCDFKLCRLGTMAYVFRPGDLLKLPVDLEVDRGSDFKAWRAQWYAHISLSGQAEQEPAKHVQVLSLCFSLETFTIVGNVGLTVAQRKEATWIVAAISQYVEGRKNDSVERHHFCQRHQQPGESFDDFLVSL